MRPSRQTGGATFRNRGHGMLKKTVVIVTLAAALFATPALAAKSRGPGQNSVICKLVPQVCQNDR